MEKLNDILGTMNIQPLTDQTKNILEKPSVGRERLDPVYPRLKVKLVTINDKVFRNQENANDKSGKAMIRVLKEYDEIFDQDYYDNVVVVPEKKDIIQMTIVNDIIGSDKNGDIELIITSGGTGYK